MEMRKTCWPLIRWGTLGIMLAAACAEDVDDDVDPAPSSLPEGISVVLTNADGLVPVQTHRRTPPGSERFIVVATSQPLAAEDTNAATDIYRIDVENHEAVLVSVGADGFSAPGHSEQADMSADGGVVVFQRVGPSLVAGGSAEARGRVYVRQLATRVTTELGPDDGAGAVDCDLARLSSNGPTAVIRCGDGVTSQLLVHRVGDSDAPRSITNNRSGSGPAAGRSEDVAISADGQVIAFLSTAPDLVSNDDNSGADVFVHDVGSRRTELASVSRTGFSSGQTVSSPTLSADGRVLAFVSRATDLTEATLTSSSSNVFVRLLAEQRTVLVSRSVAALTDGGNGDSLGPVLSADGAVVAFTSSATDLVDSIAPPGPQVFVTRRDTVPVTSLVSVLPAGPNRDVAFSVADVALASTGLTVAFALALPDGSTFDDGDTVVAMFRRDLAPESTVTGVGFRPDNTNAALPRLSANGGAVTMVFGQPGGVDGVVHRVLDVGFDEGRVTARVARSTPANGVSESQPSVSADGRFVAFVSASSDLSGAQDRFVNDIYVLDRATGTVALVSQPGDGTFANQSSSAPQLSADGSIVAFSSMATNLTGVLDDNRGDDIFVRRLDGSPVRLISGIDGFAGNLPSREHHLAADGRSIAWVSVASNLTSPLTNDDNADIFLRPLSGDGVPGPIELITLNFTGRGSGNDASHRPQLSADGDVVVYTSEASNLVTDLPDNGTNVFARLRSAQRTVLVSGDRNGIAAGLCGRAVVSADGGTVAFESFARNIVPDRRDDNNGLDVFVRSLRGNGPTVLASVTWEDNAAGERGSDMPLLSADGGVIVFRTAATTLVRREVPHPGRDHLIRRDLEQKTSTVLGGIVSDFENLQASLSADGEVVAFASVEDEGVAVDDTNDAPDVFVWQRDRPLTCLSVEPSGSRTASGRSVWPALASNGHTVALVSDAADLVGLDGNGEMDLFVVGLGGEEDGPQPPPVQGCASVDGAGWLVPLVLGARRRRLR